MERRLAQMKRAWEFAPAGASAVKAHDAGLGDPEQWRTLAEEVRSEAKQIINGRAKQIMLKIAETYEAMPPRVQKESRPLMIRAAK
jgi:hypothetical protein